MSINLTTHYVQQYSTNIQLLLQQKGSKLRSAVTAGAYTGKQASPVDQIGKIEMQAVTSRFAPMGRIDAPTDRRWVFPSDFDLPQMIDSFDKLRIITDPQSSYVQNAVMAAGRQMDQLICSAFVGTAKTGESGGTSTAFGSSNAISVSVGGANSRLNVTKLREAKRLMMSNFIDFDTEEAYVGITANDHDALLGEIQITNADYNGGQAVLRDGKIMEYMGFKFIHCEQIETVLAGTSKVTLPVWVKSGMHLGLWNEVENSVSQRHDLQGEPWQLYTKMTAGATRLEENKVYSIDSYR